MSIGTRLKEARAAAKLTQAELAVKSGLKQSTISDLEKGKSQSSRSAALLASILGVSPLWLETGRGSRDPVPAHLTHYLPKGGISGSRGNLVLVSPEENAASGEKRRATREQPQVHSPVMVFDADDGVPDHVVLVPESRIEFSAGDGRINYEVVDDKEPVPYQRSFFQKQHINPDRVRRFPVTGDSMEPMLFGGDTILVNLDETDIIDGKLYALRYGDQLRVKFLSKRIDGTLILRSLNPAYKDEEIPAELANEHITIIGRVRDRSGTGGL